MEFQKLNNKQLLERVRVLDTINVSVSDSFVMHNKSLHTSGSGESRLYIGSKTEVSPFFDKEFINSKKSYRAFVTKDDLKYYLNTAESEYLEPQSLYRNQDKFESYYKSYINNVDEMESSESFLIKARNDNN